MARSPFQHAQHLADQGRTAEAEQACRRAMMARPNDPAGMRLLARLTRHPAGAAESVQLLERLRQMRPNDRQLVGELGASLVVAGESARALGSLTEAVRAMPGVARWQAWLGRCLIDLGQTERAITVLERARGLDPDDSAAAFHLADALKLAGQLRRAEAAARAHLALEPDHPAGAVLLADILQFQGEYDEARALYEGVLDGLPEFTPARNGLSRCLRDLGRYDEALELLEPVLSGDPDGETVLAAAAAFSGLKRHAESRALLERHADDESIAPATRSALHFRLGSTLDAMGEHDAAFGVYSRANELAGRTFDREARGARYESIRRVFTTAVISNAPKSGVDGGRCVFLVGMPRSGTTLLEQALDAHPQVFGAGELDEIPECVRAITGAEDRSLLDRLGKLTREQLDEAGTRYLRRIESLAPDDTLVIDKLPHNFAWLGFIHRALPGARIIHIERHPLDTCVSCFATDLSMRHSYANDLADTGWEYGQYQRMMRHWRDCGLPMVEVRYEELVEDLEKHTRRVLGFLGLDWDERCLRFFESGRAVTTASVDQVRQPLYSSSVGRWQRYRAHLGPLIESLRAEGVELPGV